MFQLIAICCIKILPSCILGLASAETVYDGGSEIARVKLMKYARELRMEEEGEKGQKLASIKRDILPLSGWKQLRGCLCSKTFFKSKIWIEKDWMLEILRYPTIKNEIFQTLNFRSCKVYRTHAIKGRGFCSKDILYLCTLVDLTKIRPCAYSKNSTNLGMRLQFKRDL